MVMKSRLFGFGAKMALAVLAVSTFASCYDSENGDVSKPYEAPNPVYTVSGTITDALTGQVITDAQVTVTDAKGAVSFSNGTYAVQVNTAGTKTVEVSATDYVTESREIVIAELGKGEASTTVANFALMPLTIEEEFDVNDVTITPVASTVTTETRVLKASGDPQGEDEFLGLDLTADEEAATFDRTFDVVVGSVTDPENIADAFAGAPAELLAYANSYLGGVIGQFGAAQTIEVPYTISIPPYYCVESVTVTYAVVSSTYEFAYAGETYTVTVKGVRSYTFTTQFLPNHGFSHSHGHGHGHGDNINAGGGILTGDM